MLRTSAGATGESTEPTWTTRPPYGMKICPRRKRWIDIDQIHLSREPGQQRGQHIFLIAPNQAIAPVGRAADAEQVKRLLAILGALVDRLDGLEGQLDAERRFLRAIGVIFAIPDKLGGHGFLIARQAETRASHVVCHQA
jgi:hypothetical protein